MTLTDKQASMMMKNLANQKMRKTTNTSKPYQIEDRFVKTEWVEAKSYEKANQMRMEKSLRENRTMKENQPVEEGKMKHTTSSFDKLGSTLPVKSAVSGGSLANRKLKEKKESSNVYY